MPPTAPDDTSTLERLRQKLYAPQAPESFPAPSLSETPHTAPSTEGWVPPAAPPPAKKKRFSYAALFLGVAAVFFLLAVAASAYFLVFGGRSVSTDSIEITADGPTTISSGDTVTVVVSIKNENPVPATNTILRLDLPDTARSPESQETQLPDYEDTVGDIPAGETGTRSVRVALFGSENERIIIPIRFEYRIEGSNAVFVKESDYEVTITSSPLSVRAEAVSEVSAGQPLIFAVTVKSNAAAPLENVGVLATYPTGFTPKRGEGPVFPIGTLAPGEEKTIAVSGTIVGEENDERFFRFSAGLRQGENTNALLVSYSTAEVPVGLKKPFLSTVLSVNRDSTNAPVIDAGTSVQSIVSWTNTLQNALLDGEVSVKLAGAALDTSSVTAYGGFYRSSDTTILYSRETDNSLANIAPGATGSGSFNFKTKPATQLVGMKNPTVTATISVAGRRVGESNVPQSVASSVVRTIRVGTDLTLSGASFYSTGPFKNTGPWPPVVDQETSYTVTLSLANTVNAVADTTVTGVLPSYVRYVSATDSSVTYNATSRTVTWKAGEVPAGAGYGSAQRSVSFQVVLLPSASQRGTSPILVSSLKATGYDLFTKKQLSVSRPEVNTQTSSDPAFVQGKAEVK